MLLDLVRKYLEEASAAYADGTIYQVAGLSTNSNLNRLHVYSYDVGYASLLQFQETSILKKSLLTVRANGGFHTPPKLVVITSFVPDVGGSMQSYCHDIGLSHAAKRQCLKVAVPLSSHRLKSIWTW